MARWITPDAIRATLRARYARHAGAWALDEGTWPLRLPLGTPTQAQAQAQWDLFEGWLRQWRGIAHVETVERRWPALGVQQLPTHARFDCALAVAQTLGEEEPFARAQHRAHALLERWPALRPALRAQFADLSGLDECDFQRLIQVWDWLLTHPASGLYPRQLPIAGIDSKWLEGTPQRILRDWLHALRAEADAETRDFLTLAGLRALPERLHLRLLDANLRAAIGGLGDLIAPIDDLARLALPGLRRVYIVENLQTGLAFGDLPASALIIGLGYAVDVLERLPWLRDKPLHYWGDIDTHGFAILDRLRRHLPHAHSLLMDEATVLRYRPLWVEEPKPHTAPCLPALTDAEAALYADLRRSRWIPRLRLEQERIDWDHAWPQIRARAVDTVMIEST